MNLMKKSTLAILIPLCFSVSSYALDLDKVSRDSLLSNDRLITVASVELKEHSVQEVQALKKKLESAETGETILLAPGKYPNLGTVKITANNITIQAEKAGTSWLTGSLQLHLDGDDSVISGLVFTEGGPNEESGGIIINGDNNTLTNSTFYYFNDGYEYKPDDKRQEFPKRLWMTVWGESVNITLNRFEGKQKRGAIILIRKNDTPDNHVIENNIFLDMQKNIFGELDNKDAIRYNSNSWEAIQIGYSSSSQYLSNSSFSHNLMINMDGEQELIAIKSGGNKLNGNTIYKSAGLISLRHGKANHVENNVIIGGNKDRTGGVRIYDEDHVINNNYITQTVTGKELVAGNADIRAGIVINTGITDPSKDETLSQDKKGKELNKQWTPKNITISNNSLIGNAQGIVYGEQVHRASMYDNSIVKSVFGGDTVNFSHNFVYSDQPQSIAVKATDITPITNVTYDGEVYIGKIVESSYVKDFSSKKPNTTKKNGFFSAENVGADVSKLKIITAETAGPSYVITK